MATLNNVFDKYIRDRGDVLDRLSTLHSRESVTFVVTKIGGVGDTLSTLPVVRAIEERWSESHGWLIVDESMGMKDLLLEDSVSLVEISKGEGFKGLWKNWSRISQRLNRPIDLYLDLTQSLRSLYFGKFSGAKLKLGYKWHRFHRWFLDLAVSRSFTKFEGESLMDVPRMIGLDRDVSIPSYEPPDSFHPDYEQWVQSVGLASDEDFLLLNPGASTVDKRWNVEKWPRLIEELHRAFPCRQVLLEGPSEEGITDRITSKISDTSLRDELVTNQNRPLGEVAHLAHQANGIVTNDTYLLHLGITLGTPTFCIFNNKDPFRYRFKRGLHDCIFDLETSRPEVNQVVHDVRCWIEDAGLFTG